MNTKQKISIAVVVFLIGITTGMATLYTIQKKDVLIPVGTACTMEAKLCSDGSAVGREGTNCEFLPCPSETVIIPMSPEQLAVGCVVGGCSGQMCAEATPDNDGLVSTCEWRKEYVCYRTAECKKQANGQCGWTPTTELASCLQKAK